jgi:formate dehydrogenase iron-sulfur subunit
MSKSFLIDTTLCTGCRGCQVACKQWHNLPAEKTKNVGSYQNPQDLSFDTYKLVRMNEVEIDGELKWLYFPEQCRHCIDAPCEAASDYPPAIYTEPATGAVVYTANTREIYEPRDVVDACPYNVPRQGANGLLAKCDMCIDRVENGLLPACVKTCPTGAMNFGDREKILDLARQRLQEVRSRFPNAMLIDPEAVRVIYLVAFDPKLYHSYAMASAAGVGITRQMALRRMFKPLRAFGRGMRAG